MHTDDTARKGGRAGCGTCLPRAVFEPHHEGRNGGTDEGIVVLDRGFARLNAGTVKLERMRRSSGVEMAVIERSIELDVPLDVVEREWREFCVDRAHRDGSPPDARDLLERELEDTTLTTIRSLGAQRTLFILTAQCRTNGEEGVDAAAASFVCERIEDDLRRFKTFIERRIGPSA